MTAEIVAVIKATARLQEADEPARQRPIIKIDPRHQQELMAHINDATLLANSIRASIDSGRDNPFRPDGEIYKLTNPIVDYYKYGPNQSRSQTPNYTELLADNGDEGGCNSVGVGASKKNKKSKNKSKTSKDEKRSWKRQKRQENVEASNVDAAADQQPSCWRRWFCCCCCCCGSRNRSSNNAGQEGKTGANRMTVEVTVPDYGPPSQARNNKKTSNDLTLTKFDDASRGDSDNATPQSQKASNILSSRPQLQQQQQQGSQKKPAGSRVVLVDDRDELDTGERADSKGKTPKKAKKPNSKPGAINGSHATSDKPETGHAAPEVTQVKTSRCVVS